MNRIQYLIVLNVFTYYKYDIIELIGQITCMDVGREKLIIFSVAV